MNSSDDYGFKPEFSRMYFAIIEHRRHNIPTGYTETHHVVPKAIGGPDKAEWNRVKLTAREHFICHALLLRMISNTSHREKMIHAAHNMIYWKSGDNQRKFKISSRMYQLLKEEVSKVRRVPLTPEQRKLIFTPERMKNVWASKRRKYEIVFPNGQIHIVDDLSKWCAETGHSKTTLRDALKTTGIVESKHAKGQRGSGCVPSKLEGVKIRYLD